MQKLKKDGVISRARRHWRSRSSGNKVSQPSCCSCSCSWRRTARGRDGPEEAEDTLDLKERQPSWNARRSDSSSSPPPISIEPVVAVASDPTQRPPLAFGQLSAHITAGIEKDRRMLEEIEMAVETAAKQSDKLQQRRRQQSLLQLLTAAAIAANNATLLLLELDDVENQPPAVPPCLGSTVSAPSASSRTMSTRGGNRTSQPRQAAAQAQAARRQAVARVSNGSRPNNPTVARARRRELPSAVGGSPSEKKERRAKASSGRARGAAPRRAGAAAPAAVFDT